MVLGCGQLNDDKADGAHRPGGISTVRYLGSSGLTDDSAESAAMAYSQAGI